MARRRFAALIALLCAGLMTGCGSSSQRTASGSAADGSAVSGSDGRIDVSGSGAGASGRAAASIPSGDWPGFGYDTAHSGAGPASGITAANARSLVLRRVTLDATGDSAPIELHAVTVAGRSRDVVIVTGTDGKTIAIDAGTGARLWEFRPSGQNSTVTDATPGRRPRPQRRLHGQPQRRHPQALAVDRAPTVGPHDHL